MNHKPLSSVIKKCKIGFVGIGKMGLPMVKNLSQKLQPLHPIRIFDTKVKCEPLGIRLAFSKSLRDLSADCDVIFTMLPSSKIVKDVYLANDGILKNTKLKTVLCDCSTTHPNVIREIGREAEKLNISFSDAPVSGGMAGAIHATLTFMHGGSKEAHEILAPAFTSMGKRAVHTGPLGSGIIMKICNNLILGVAMASLCESLALCTRLGADVHMLSSIINTSTGRSWSSEVNNPIPGIDPESPSSKNYVPGFASVLMWKDLKLALDVARGVGAKVPLCTLVNKIYKKTCTKDRKGMDDFSIIIQHFLQNKNQPSKK